MKTDNPLLKHWIKKVVSLIVVGVLFGWLYAWAAPRFYKPSNQAGLFMGVMHGALMPIAFPSLLLGEDVPIYSSNNTGRTYKIGYISGVNLCGLLFFGLAFRKPAATPVTR
jgi:hypothetical protein